MGAGTPKTVMSNGVMIEPPPTPVRPTTMPTPRPVAARRPKSPKPVTFDPLTTAARGGGNAAGRKQCGVGASPKLRPDEDQRRADHGGMLKFSQRG